MPMNVRGFALAVGVIYLLMGVAGFVPDLGDERVLPDLRVDSQYQDLFGWFPVNILHSIVHLAVGVLGLLAARDLAAARYFSRGLAVFFAVLAVMGLVEAGNLDTTFRLIPLFDNDVWLHAVTAALAALFGWLPAWSAESTQDLERRRLHSADKDEQGRLI